MPHPAPDIVLLAAEWQPRALLRAQLIEDGFEVVATETWREMQEHLHPAARPRLAVVDLQGLSGPGSVLEDLRFLMRPERVVVLGAGATLPADRVEAMGFRFLARPFSIRDVSSAVRAVVQSRPAPLEP
jgi:DNA-binding response OmpR family regulator